MNRFINYVVEKSKGLDLTLKINYSSHRGWNIKLHKTGYDMPSIEVQDQDKDKAFNRAYRLTKEYMEEKEKKNNGYS